MSEQEYGCEEFTSAFHRSVPWIEARLSEAEIEPGVYDRTGMHPLVESELDRQLARGPHAFAPEVPESTTGVQIS